MEEMPESEGQTRIEAPQTVSQQPFSAGGVHGKQPNHPKQAGQGLGVGAWGSIEGSAFAQRIGHLEDLFVRNTLVVPKVCPKDLVSRSTLRKGWLGQDPCIR